MARQKEKIIGKYIVEDYTKPKQVNRMATDNAIEAMWEANKFPKRRIINVCGEREFYQDETGKYRLVKLEQ